MKTDRDIQAEIKKGIRTRKDQEFAAMYGGAVMLDELWERLQPFQRDYDAFIDMGPRTAKKSIEIRRELNTDPVAKWTRQGLTMIFASTGRGAEARTVAEAISVTLHFLETGTVPASASKPGRLGFL